MKSPIPLITSIVSESLPHLKRGAMRDFFNIIDEPIKGNPHFNMTENTYYAGKSIIEFFGADESDKVRGPRRHILFINEANNVPWDTARGLDIRTARFTFADWNPVSEFWVHQYEAEDGKMIPGWIHEPDSAYIHSTYLDALQVLPKEVVANIESNKDKDPNWWNVYGLGLIGKVEGLVYPFFSQENELPRGEILYGLDFGFSNHPTALTANVLLPNVQFPTEVHSRELVYEVGLTNQDIAQRMLDLGIKKNFDEIIADSAEPKSIEEIYRYGFNIKPCVKGQDSVEYGHQKVRQLKQFWTKDSTNCIKEQRNFRYMKDKNGKFTDKTTHNFSHGMDSRRYAVMGTVPVPQERTVVFDTMSLLEDVDL